MIKIWPEVNLSIKDVHKGLLVKQKEDEYFARLRTLSEDVINTIELAIANGLHCIIRDKHPVSRNLLSRNPLSKGV